MRLPRTEAKLIELIKEANNQLFQVRMENKKQIYEYIERLIATAKKGDGLLVVRDMTQFIHMSPGGVSKSIVVKSPLTIGGFYKIQAIQPRLKRVWLKHDKDAYCVDGNDLACLQLHPDEFTAAVAFTSKKGKAYDLSYKLGIDV